MVVKISPGDSNCTNWGENHCFKLNNVYVCPELIGTNFLALTALVTNYQMKINYTHGGKSVQVMKFLFVTLLHREWET
jgi:hypothetical protein